MILLSTSLILESFSNELGIDVVGNLESSDYYYRKGKSLE